MRFVDLVNIAQKAPDTKLWDRMHEVERNAKDVYDEVIEMVRAGVPPEQVQEECDNYHKLAIPLDSKGVDLTEAGRYGLSRDSPSAFRRYGGRLYGHWMCPECHAVIDADNFAMSVIVATIKDPDRDRIVQRNRDEGNILPAAFAKPGTLDVVKCPKCTKIRPRYDWSPEP